MISSQLIFLLFLVFCAQLAQSSDSLKKNACSTHRDCHFDANLIVWFEIMLQEALLEVREDDKAKKLEIELFGVNKRAFIKQL